MRVGAKGLSAEQGTTGDCELRECCGTRRGLSQEALVGNRTWTGALRLYVYPAGPL